jgi:hypothetical protein
MARTGRPDIPILARRVEWDCPNCTQVAVTTEARPHTRFHVCPGTGGLELPFVQVDANRGRVNVKPVVREDYVGKEKGLRYDAEGRPIMGIVTEYDDGTNDAAVYAPVARIEMKG